MDGATVFTIGHSTREADELVELLERNEVDLLIDVRRYPTSRRYPHFSRDPLAERLETAAVGYRHAPELGGRREVAPDSPNRAWRNAGFRAYADYMGTAGFRAALDRVMEDAGRHTVAIMCAEAVPWRCHRNLISDALAARGVEVRHILSDAEPSAHELNEMARVSEDGSVTYPGEPEPQRELFD